MFSLYAIYEPEIFHLWVYFRYSLQIMSRYELWRIIIIDEFQSVYTYKDLEQV